MCHVGQNWNHGSMSRESEKSANPDNFIIKKSLRSNKENEYPHFVFFSTNKKVIGIWKSEIILYILSQAKYNFFKYTLYPVNIFLHFITL